MEKNLPQYHPITINPTYDDLALNPKIRDDRSVVCCPRHSSALPKACEVCGVNYGKYVTLVYATYIHRNIRVLGLLRGRYVDAITLLLTFIKATSNTEQPVGNTNTA